jgi:hypothetical protein
MFSINTKHHILHINCGVLLLTPQPEEKQKGGNNKNLISVTRLGVGKQSSCLVHSRDVDAGEQVHSDEEV